LNFEDIINRYLESDFANHDFFTIVANKKRGQSDTFSVIDSSGCSIIMIKFFDYFKGMEKIVKENDIYMYNSLNDFLEDIENIDNVDYNIEEIIDNVELQRRCFNRYIKVGEIESLDCFPRLLHHEDEIKINGSFYGFLVEEYVRGATLENKLKIGTIEDRAIFAFDFLLQFGDILNKLNDNKIVHRDISPDNIIIKDDKYILIDPGVIKIDDGFLTQSRMMLGKKIYVSPEQYFGNARLATFRSDLYAVGIIALEIILGYNPLNEIIRKENVIHAPHRELLARYSRDLEDKIFMKITENEFSSKLLIIIKKLIQIEERNRFDSIDSFIATLNIMKRGGKMNNE